MPQVLKEEIRKQIKNGALEEFYTNGFSLATMKNIASRAGVPAGLIYSYFKNKEDLFSKLLKPVISEFKHSIKNDGNSASLENLYNHELPAIINCIVRYNKEVVILIDKSRGSKLEKIKGGLICQVAEHLKEVYFLQNRDLDEIFFHILATNFMEGIFEIARHYKGKEWAEKMLSLLIQHHLYGTSSFSEHRKKQ